jgi:hypothetical protein
MTILRVERAGAYNQEYWRIETLARKKNKGVIRSTTPSIPTSLTKKFQLEVSFTYICIDFSNVQRMALFSHLKAFLHTSNSVGQIPQSPPRESQ